MNAKKNTHATIALLSVALTLSSVQAATTVASVDFNGADTGISATAAQLNATSTGGTWSAISATGTNSGVQLLSSQLKLGDNASVNSIQTSTATFTLDAAATLAGASISFDYVQLGSGGQPGNVFFDIYNGATHVLRISGSPDSGGGRRTLSHWNSVGGTRTALAAEDVFGSDTIGVSFNLTASDFGVTTSGATNPAGNFNSTGLAYINGGQTTFDRIIFTAVDNKAVATIDNLSISAVPEPSSAALLGLGGLTLILRRRK